MSNHHILPINIGYGNYVMAGRILAIMGSESSPIRRKKDLLKEEGKLIDATFGRRTRSFIFLDDGTGVLSSLQPETIALRLEKTREGHFQKNHTQKGHTQEGHDG